MLLTSFKIPRYVKGACAALMLLAFAGPATADDRSLLRDSAGNPFLFVLFDTSSSMANMPPCTRENLQDQDLDVDPFDATCSSECEMGATNCARLCPDFGCIDYDYSTYTPPGAGDIITLDEDSATLDGTWTAGDGTIRDNPYNGDFRIASDASVLKSATYDPNITVGGEYQVYLWWPDDLDNLPADDPTTPDVDETGDGIGETFASNVLVDVVHDGGTSTVALDQRFDGGQWSIIGTYDITSLTATAGNVTIRNESASGLVVADGVRWVRITRPTCDQTGYRCQQPLCPLGDCYTSLRADDPSSKFVQARSALYEVVEGSPNVHFGFGTYQQDKLFFRSKHWLYRVRDTDVGGTPYTLPQLDGTDFLEVGAEEVFGNYSQGLGVPNPGENAGDGFNCVTTGISSDHHVGCEAANPADLSDPWEVERARRIPKLGRLGTYSTEAWYRVDHDDSKIYNVTYSPSTGMSFGADPFAADVEIQECPNGTCRTPPALGNGFCEIGDGEVCNDDGGAGATSDCNEETSGNPSGHFCCGVDADCTDSRCGNTCIATPYTPPVTGTVFYDLVSDYMAQDGNLERQPMREAGFFDTQFNIVSAAPAARCDGMDLNDDTTDDIWRGYNLRWSTVQDPRGSDYDFDGIPDATREDYYDIGDRVPLDWLDTNQDTLLERLSPNIVPPAEAPLGLADSPEDFRTAVYFQDEVLVGDDPANSVFRKLRLNDDAERPIIAFGSTPLANSIADFKSWYSGTAGNDDAWADFVAGEDALWACREKYLLLLTDGLEECTPPDPGDPCDSNVEDDCCDPDVDEDCFCDVNGICYLGEGCAGENTTEQLLDLGVETHVVGFGTQDDGSLSCLADAGGSELLEAANRDELIEQLNTLFDSISVESRSFASASIPAIQSSTADKIFLSSFAPLPAQSFWPGRIDAFRKPLPLTDNNRPDTSIMCADITDATADQQSACHIWEAGTQLCGQAPESVDRTGVIQSELQLGNDPATERRVVYGKASDGTVPNELQLFDLPPIPMSSGDMLDAVTEDMLLAIDPEVVTQWNASALTPAELEDFLLDLLVGTLEIKVIDSAIEDQVEGCELSGGDEGYILGDIFHANPTSIGSPGNFTYFALNTESYRDFARKHAWRRKMLATGTNDGQLHFFDSGIRQMVENNFTTAAGDFIELYNDGSGHELFSYIPRDALPILEHQVRSTRHIYSVDNTVSLGDVYIDPTDDGFDDTQWRTVLVGGLREAGDVQDTVTDVSNLKASYFALDITQPDILNPRQDTSDPTFVPCPASNASCDDTTTTFPLEYTPSCLDLFSSADGSQSTAADCDFPFPLELWTFDDSVEVAGVTYYLDEDAGVPGGNGIPDLADLWSRPVIGQIEIGDGSGGVIPKHVAIFGGGMDPDNKGDAEVGGNFLYMVDVETGQTIYKRELEGSAAADPAVLDEDRDGVFDRIYVATTNGLVYKVDLTAVSALTGELPELDTTFEVDENNLLSLDSDGTATRYTASPGGMVTVGLDRVTDAAWDPFIILDTGGPYEATPRRGSPIYHAPAAFFIPELEQYALAVGTGDREDLWNEANGEDVLPGTDPKGGVFFVFVDSVETNDPSLYNSSLDCDQRLPITQFDPDGTTPCLKNLDFTADPTAEERDTNFLLDPGDDADFALLQSDPRRGWVMDLTSDARISAEAFVVAGVMVFSAFDPTIATTSDTLCAQTGTTRTFVVSARNGGPVAPLSGETDADGDPTTSWDESATAEDRYHEIGEFTTSPFIDSTATKNPAVDAATKTLHDLIDDEISDAVRDSLVEQFPRGSRFNKAFSLVIAALRSSTGVSVYTTIPIAAYPADWKEQ